MACLQPSSLQQSFQLSQKLDMMHCLAIESRPASWHAQVQLYMWQQHWLTIHISLAKPFCSKVIHVTGIVLIVQLPISNQGFPHSHPRSVSYIMQCICHALSAAPLRDDLDGRVLLHSLLMWLRHHGCDLQQVQNLVAYFSQLLDSVSLWILASICKSALDIWLITKTCCQITCSFVDLNLAGYMELL